MSDDLTLRQRAIAARRNEVEDDRRRRDKSIAEDHAHRLRVLAKGLKEYFGIEEVAPPQWNEAAASAEVAVDGLLFVLPKGGSTYPYHPEVLLPCPRCSTLLPRTVTTLAQLGRVLEEPPKDHYGCAAEPPKPEPPAVEAPQPTTAAERVAAALEEFIAERFPMVQG